jgi:hypothetical protein
MMKHGLRRGGALRRRQAGMTTLGMIIVGCCVGMIAFAGLRLAPVYLNYMKVAGVLSGVRDEFDGQSPSRTSMRTSIERRFDIESVTELAVKDIKITSVDAGFTVSVTYDHPAPFIANVSFLVHFDNSVQIRR